MSSCHQPPFYAGGRGQSVSFAVATESSVCRGISIAILVSIKALLRRRLKIIAGGKIVLNNFYKMLELECALNFIVLVIQHIWEKTDE